MKVDPEEHLDGGIQDAAALPEHGKARGNGEHAEEQENEERGHRLSLFHRRAAAGNTHLFISQDASVGFDGHVSA